MLLSVLYNYLFLLLSYSESSYLLSYQLKLWPHPTLIFSSFATMPLLDIQAAFVQHSNFLHLQQLCKFSRFKQNSLLYRWTGARGRGGKGEEGEAF